MALTLDSLSPERRAVIEREIEILALQMAQDSRRDDLSRKVQIPKLYPLQEQIKAEAVRFNVLCVGRRAGKTYLATHLILETALKGHPTAWCVPDYKTAAEVWRDIERPLKGVATKINATEKRIELPNGGVIEIWTLENEDAGRGRKYKLVVVDEAAMARNLKEAWENALRPTLADLKGSAWFLSTPKSLNYFYELYQNGLNPDKPDWKCWQLPSSVNPYLDLEEIEAARDSLPSLAYRQEWLAEFVSDEGAVFRGVTDVLIHDVPLPKEHLGHIVVAGVDWGQQNDYTAISVFCASCKREVFLDRFNKIDWHFQRSRLIETIRQWGVRDVLCELNSIGSPNLEALRREMFDSPGAKPTIRGFQTTMKSKGDIIKALSLAIEKKNAFFLADEIAKLELLSYEMTLTEHGNAKYSAPENRHDDSVIARALAFDAAKRWYGIEPSIDEKTERDLPLTWKDSYLNELTQKDPVLAQRYYDARRSTVADIRELLANKGRPVSRYDADPDNESGGASWNDV